MPFDARMDGLLTVLLDGSWSYALSSRWSRIYASIQTRVDRGSAHQVFPLPFGVVLHFLKVLLGFCFDADCVQCVEIHLHQ